METEHKKSSKAAGHTLTYRADIDGLRAIAVLVVVLFHAKLGCSGGFVGVDIFFVISGFLITSLILREIQGSHFKAVDFWERRTRRIMPALVVMVLGTLIAAWFLYLPDDFERVGRAVMAQTVFGSNIFHWKVANYFGPLSEALPLLHTWSLAVEEQFYIIFPVALLVLCAWKRTWLAPGIWLAAALSFALSVWALGAHEKSVFYFLPTRAWELLLGSLLSAYPAWGNRAPRWIRETIALGGLAAIAIAVVRYDAHTPFPGLTALLPCLGTVAFIWANQADGTTSGRFLSWPPFVFIGQTSYSFYLLHWPVLVFSLYWFRDGLSWQWRLSLVGITFLLSVLSLIVVETPVRKKQVLAGRRRLFSVTAAAMLLLLASGEWVHLKHGFPNRFGPQALKYAAARDDYAFRFEVDLPAAQSGDFTKIGTPDGPVKCLLWGDSHAMALTSVLDTLCREKGYRGFAAAHSGTAPLVNFVSRGTYAMKGKSLEFAETVVKFAVDQHVQTVVMAARWNVFTFDPAFEESLRHTVNRLVSAGLKVVIVRDVPLQAGDVPWLLAKTSKLGGDVRTIGVPLDVHREKNKIADAIFAKLAGPNITILDPAPSLVDDTGLCRAEYNGDAMYFDSDHLTVTAALRLKPLFEPIF